MEPNDKIYKRGDVRDDGKVFWQYKRERANPEYWITASNFERRLAPERLRCLKRAQMMRLKSQHQVKTLKRGDTNGEGLVFWKYEPCMINGERWVTPIKFKELKDRTNYLQRQKRSRAKQKEYMKNRRGSDVLFRLAHNARTRMGQAFKNLGYSKGTKTEKILGCSFEELKSHIESTFTTHMSWENKGEWHIDHRLPLSAATNEEELGLLCHYTNTQAMWAEDNLSKGDKYKKQQLQKYLTK